MQFNPRTLLKPAEVKHTNDAFCHAKPPLVQHAQDERAHVGHGAVADSVPKALSKFRLGPLILLFSEKPKHLVTFHPLHCLLALLQVPVQMVNNAS